MFDITTQAAVDRAFIHLKGIDGTYLYADGKKVGVVIFGPGSTAYADLEDRQVARSLKRRQDNDGKLAVAPRDQREAEAADDLASITVSFENLGYPPAGDKQGRDLFAALYADKTLGFIPAQILKALGDWGNFKNGSTAS